MIHSREVAPPAQSLRISLDVGGASRSIQSTLIPLKADSNRFMALPSKEDLLHQIMLTTECAWRNNLGKADIDRWLSNFDGSFTLVEREHHLALWLLNNFVYYNKDEVRPLCSNLFSHYLHLLVQENPSHADPRTLEQELRKTTFTHLGRPSESGGFLLYLFRQENDLRVSSFIGTDAQLALTERLVVIDDVSLTGDQASSYLRNLRPKLTSLKMAYFLALMTTDRARSRIQTSGFETYSPIDLHEAESCFSTGSRIFHLSPADQSETRAFCLHYGARCFPSHPLGFGDESRLLAFFYNTPDNTLPIFWATEGQWNPLFRRYHKNYSHIGKHGLKRFI